MQKNINLPLQDYCIRNIIHIGAGAGEYIKYYSDLNIQKIVWFEKEYSLYNDLYKNTCRFNIEQKYYFIDLIDEDLDQSNLTFKSFWRKVPYDIDIEKYDTLIITENKDVLKVIKGFKEFKSNFKNIVLFENNRDIEDFMNSIGYDLIIYSNHYLYLNR